MGLKHLVILALCCYNHGAALSLSRVRKYSSRPQSYRYGFHRAATQIPTAPSFEELVVASLVTLAHEGARAAQKLKSFALIKFKNQAIARRCKVLLSEDAKRLKLNVDEAINTIQLLASIMFPICRIKSNLIMFYSGRN